jgi:hypothetical protein
MRALGFWLLFAARHRGAKAFGMALIVFGGLWGWLFYTLFTMGPFGGGCAFPCVR